jgi:hypothetical protein
MVCTDSVIFGPCVTLCFYGPPPAAVGGRFGCGIAARLAVPFDVEAAGNPFPWPGIAPACCMAHQVTLSRTPGGLKRFAQPPARPAPGPHRLPP